MLAVILLTAGIWSTPGLTVERKAVGTDITKGVRVKPPTNVGPTVAPLTAGECEGLGGKVETANQLCNAKGQSACKTVDKNGVVRVACIDGVKN